jgi:hypothetical protein
MATTEQDIALLDAVIARSATSGVQTIEHADGRRYEPTEVRRSCSGARPVLLPVLYRIGVPVLAQGANDFDVIFIGGSVW